MSLRSPLGRVLGYGSAGEGTEHWWSQRVSALALVALGLWMLGSFLGLGSFEYQTVRGWIAAPLNSVLLLLLVATLAYHSSLGVQVILEDYVHAPFLKVSALLLNKAGHAALAAAAAFAVLKVSFG